MKSTITNNKLLIEMELSEINPDILSYLSALEISSKSRATEDNVYELAHEINQKWWKNNQNRFLNEDSN